MNKKIFSLFVSLFFAAVILVPDVAQAYFWRTSTDTPGDRHSSPDNPEEFVYGYGYGTSGYGYGYGYGYSYYMSDKQNTGYMGPTTVAGGTAGSGVTTTTGTVTGNVTFSTVKTSGGVVTLSAGAITVRNSDDTNIYVSLPSGATITGGANWDGIFQMPAVITDTSVTGYPSSTNSDVLLIGSSSVSLTLSAAATVYIPINSFDSGKTYTIYRVPAGSATAGTLTTITNSSCLPSSTAGRFYCPFTTTSFSMFYGTGATSTTTETTTTTGGGGGGLNKADLQKKKVAVKEKKVTEKAVITTEGYKAGEVAEKFKDVSGHWAKDYIEQLRTAGIAHGKVKGQFAPNDKLTRAELTKIALNAFNIPVKDKVSVKPFSDVGTGAWYAVYVAKAKELNIIQGYKDGTFKPDQPINRAEALKILLVASGLDIKSDTLKDLAAKGWTYMHFIDVPISAWYAVYVDYAKSNGIVSGYGNGLFGPQNFVLRGEMAKIAVKTMELAK